SEGLDVFIALTDPELGVIRAMGAHADRTVTLPSVEGPNCTREALLGMGFEERRFARRRAEPAAKAFSAPTIDREAEEVARRIVAEVDAGRQFREVGIIVRNPDVYVPALRAALERFGIPARSYFSDAVGEHAAARYVSAVVKALLSLWYHA